MELSKNDIEKRFPLLLSLFAYSLGQKAMGDILEEATLESDNMRIAFKNLAYRPLAVVTELKEALANVLGKNDTCTPDHNKDVVDFLIKRSDDYYDIKSPKLDKSLMETLMEMWYGAVSIWGISPIMERAVETLENSKIMLLIGNAIESVYEELKEWSPLIGSRGTHDMLSFWAFLNINLQLEKEFRNHSLNNFFG